ncbi:hypothetical protein KFL_000750210 [Klebsormidium nitens]|uniref:Hydroxyproline O-arabinosyltransferase-like domain-containing protein n=1 Tax=Klebsormidium nitens TaxID=105231 RepID=A0A0U9HIZ4_KLENI|nr:hypothetical protein KFL_000750210 [Klebsormidium nitens]|eukprot:GAQ81253.1 hypothetical protein KFL_000750210 [Klebsormidium nitens]
MPRVFTVLVLLWALPHASVEGRPLRKEEPSPPSIHTVFSAECNDYFDWQTVALEHSFRTSGQPGPLTRLLSCNPKDLGTYRGMDLAPTFVVPSWSRHPKTGDWYPAINKPLSILHWLTHADVTADYVVILDADMILRTPVLPWELGAAPGTPVSARYGYLEGCANELVRLHASDPERCDRVGGFMVHYTQDLRKLAPLWLSKTEEMRADRAHWHLMGDIYGQGWISEMYGYAFGASEAGLVHKIDDFTMLYPGYVPAEGTGPKILHYGLPYGVGSWTWEKGHYRHTDLVNTCRVFPEPPNPAELPSTDPSRRRGDLLGIECMVGINRALLEHHAKRGGCKEIFEDFGNGTVHRKEGHVAASAKEQEHVAAFRATPEMRTAGAGRGAGSESGSGRFVAARSVENGESGDRKGEENAGTVAGKADDSADVIERDAAARSNAAASRALNPRVLTQPLDEMPNGVLWAALVYVILVAFWLVTTRRMTQSRPRPRASLEGFRGLEGAVGRAETGKAKE